MGFNVASTSQFQQVAPHQKHHAKGAQQSGQVDQAQPNFGLPQLGNANQAQPSFGLPQANDSQQQPSMQQVLQMLMALLQQGGSNSQAGQAGAQAAGAKSC